LHNALDARAIRLARTPRAGFPFPAINREILLKPPDLAIGADGIPQARPARGNRIGWGSIVGADPQDLHFNPQTDSGVELGESNTLREYVTIHRGSQAGGITRIGANNFLMTGVHLAHDVQMGDHNVLANNVLLAGHIQVGNKCFLGGGSVFHQFIHIGDYAIAQGNAAISQDIPLDIRFEDDHLLVVEKQ
jgi:UDP-N-acetylglucosamine acyltransferase